MPSSVIATDSQIWTITKHLQPKSKSSNQFLMARDTPEVEILETRGNAEGNQHCTWNKWPKALRGLPILALRHMWWISQFAKSDFSWCDYSATKCLFEAYKLTMLSSQTADSSHNSSCLSSEFRWEVPEFASIIFQSPPGVRISGNAASIVKIIANSLYSRYGGSIYQNRLTDTLSHQGLLDCIHSCPCQNHPPRNGNGWAATATKIQASKVSWGV